MKRWIKDQINNFDKLLDALTAFFNAQISIYCHSGKKFEYLTYHNAGYPLVPVDNSFISIYHK